MSRNGRLIASLLVWGEIEGVNMARSLRNHCLGIRTSLPNDPLAMKRHYENSHLSGKNLKDRVAESEQAPRIKLVGTSGLGPEIPIYQFMNKQGCELSDEHCSGAGVLRF